MNSVAEKILSNAEETPEKIAVIDDAGAVTYRELAEMIRSTASKLRSCGLCQGDRVVWLSTPTRDHLAMCYGAHLAGVVFVPVEYRAPEARLREIAEAVGAARIVTAVDELPDADGDFDFSPKSDDVAEILFTTGTTGKSKGVMLSNGSLTSYVSTVNTAVDMKEDTVFLINTPLNHAGGSRRMHMSMANGSTVSLIAGVRDLAKFFRRLREDGVTATYLPPASVRLILTLSGAELNKYDHQLDFIYTGSAPFPESDRQKLRSLLPTTRLFNAYGSSEIGSVCNYDYNSDDSRLDCIGKPYPGVDVKLRCADGSFTDEPLKSGLICVASPMNMLGYINEPELNEKVFDGRYIKTSDEGYFDADGYLYFCGRSDDVINVGGLKVAPSEVEQAALGFDGIADCVCTSCDDAVSGKAVKLLVVMEKGAELSRRDITEYLRTKLEAYKLPRYIEPIDAVPRTFNGKINRKALLAK